LSSSNRSRSARKRASSSGLTTASSNTRRIRGRSTRKTTSYPAHGRLVERTGRYRAWPITGAFLLTIAVTGLASLQPDTPLTLTAIYVLVLGTGAGFVMQPSLLAAQNSVDQRELGIATSTALLSRALGNTIGIPIFGGILNAGLDGSRSPAAFADALPMVFLAAVPVGIASIAITWRLRDRPLREEVVLAGVSAP